MIFFWFVDLKHKKKMHVKIHFCCLFLLGNVTYPSLLPSFPPSCKMYKKNCAFYMKGTPVEVERDEEVDSFIYELISNIKVAYLTNSIIEEKEKDGSDSDGDGDVKRTEFKNIIYEKRVKVPIVPISSKLRKDRTLLKILYELGVQLLVLKFDLIQFDFLGCLDRYTSYKNRYKSEFIERVGRFNKDVSFVVPFPKFEKLNSLIMICGGYHKTKDVMEGVKINTKHISEGVLNAILIFLDSVKIEGEIHFLQNTKNVVRVKEPNDVWISKQLNEDIFRIRHPKKLKQVNQKLYVILKANTTFCDFCVPKCLSDRVRVCVDAKYSSTCVCFFTSQFNTMKRTIKECMLPPKKKKTKKKNQTNRQGIGEVGENQ